MTDYALTLWLIAARRPENIRDLEQRVGKTQAQVVDEVIAQWRVSLRQYADGHGTPEERLKVVRRFIAELHEHGDLVMAMREPN